MKKKIYYERLENFCGLEYLTVEKAPMYDHPEYGTVVDITAAEETKIASRYIIRHMVPLRGKEVSILRRSLGLSLDKFGRAFGLSAGAVLKWERAKDTRLSLVNELVVRLYCAEVMKLQVPHDYSKLIDVEEPTKQIMVSVA
jgi:DNA-binding transcriptional regulator YiaG